MKPFTSCFSEKTDSKDRNKDHIYIQVWQHHCAERKNSKWYNGGVIYWCQTFSNETFTSLMASSVSTIIPVRVKRQTLAQQVNSCCRHGVAPVRELRGKLHKLFRGSLCFLTTTIIIFYSSRLNEILFFYDRLSRDHRWESAAAIWGALKWLI